MGPACRFRSLVASIRQSQEQDYEDLPYIRQSPRAAKCRAENSLASQRSLDAQPRGALSCRPGLCQQLRPAIAQAVLKEYLVEGSGIRACSPHCRPKYAIPKKTKRDSEFGLGESRPGSRIAGDDSTFQGVINLLRQNAFSKFFVARRSENKLFLSPLEGRGSGLELNIRRLPIQRRKPRSSTKPPPRIPQPRIALPSYVGARGGLKKSVTLAEDAEGKGELYNFGRFGKPKPKPMCPQHTLPAGDAAIYYNSVETKRSAGKFLVCRNKSSNAQPRKPEERKLLPTLGERGKISTANPSPVAAANPPKAKHAKRTRTTTRRKSVSRAGDRRPAVKEENPPPPERLKQRSKPVFLAQDFDYTVLICGNVTVVRDNVREQLADSATLHGEAVGLLARGSSFRLGIQLQVAAVFEGLQV